MPDLINKKLGQHRILEEIGRGGMATVYKARDAEHGRHVAIKVLHAQLTVDALFVKRFRQEAAAASSLSHPNIVAVYDVGQEAGLYYLVMEYLVGQPLSQLIEPHTPWPLRRTLRVISQVADALDYAHRQGFIHRDIKPSNIIVGPGDHATLTDFGIAKATSGTTLTRTGMLIGTPQYMSPEQCLGKGVHSRSDIYSLGVVLYEMLTGHVPFSADNTPSILYMHVHETMVSPRSHNPALPVSAERVLGRALAKRPEERYATAVEMAQALDAAATETVAAEEPATVAMAQEAPTIVAPGKRRLRLPVPIIVVGILAAVVVLVEMAMLASRGSLPLVALGTPTHAVFLTATSTPVDPAPVAQRGGVTTPVEIPTSTHEPTATYTVTPTREPTTTWTPSPSHTPRPTATPTATISADPAVYDNFDNPANDGEFNHGRWKYWGTPQGVVVQQDGVIMLTQHVDEPHHNTWLIARQYDHVRLESPTYFEASLMLSPGGDACAITLKLYAERSGGGSWFADCHVGDGGAGCYDSNWPADDLHEYRTLHKPVGRATWHVLRVEMDPATMTFSYYVDGEPVGSHVPVDAAELRDATYWLTVGAYGEAVTGYVDNVRIGPPGSG
jgi:tRNA A-37 threonylcarbamoyl transferase component Bud32